MAFVKSELEVPSSVSAPKLFKAFLDFRNLAPKVEPESFKTIDFVKGDGGVGTVQETTFVDGSKTKLTIDAIDHNNLSLTTTIFEGGEWMQNLESATYQAKFVPEANQGSTYKVSSVYKCKDPAKFTQENAKFADEYTKKTFKAIEAYIIANPNAVVADLAVADTISDGSATDISDGSATEGFQRRISDGGVSATDQRRASISDGSATGKHQRRISDRQASATDQRRTSISDGSATD
ncbi:hypothetical protein OSB04_018948 [Centaurea solstitialis]|uniref:Bet v I/Major latex protein domain-containing protein n=1 Tax=Centaurea solstitialis TaxID=347529 RepID=A0AA38SPB8_9ASTR|nr:hypothetical protein OSB04_018948 [Centaurea solstitialis]